MGWRSRNPLARACHDIAKLDRLTAQRHESEGRVLTTLVGIRDEQAVYTTTFITASERAAWWDYEPEEYDGA